MIMIVHFFCRYQKQHPGDLHKTGSALLYESALKPQTPEVFFVPVGLVLDRGLGAPQWGDYLDCYGHGRCAGLSGNFECESTYQAILQCSESIFMPLSICFARQVRPRLLRGLSGSNLPHRPSLVPRTGCQRNRTR